MENERLPSIVKIVLLSCVLLFIFACGGKGLYVAPEFKDLKYKKTGILVCRVGTKYPYNSPVEITSETNYAQTVPGLKNDIIIEDERRIPGALRLYPAFEEYPGIHYYGNITKTIYENVAQTLQDKGYEVMDVRAYLARQGRNVNSMTVQDILNRMKGTCPAIYILHYVDIGPVAAKSLKRQDGFNGLFYRMVVFDTGTGARLLHYYAAHNHFSLLESFANDGVLIKTGKVKVETNTFGDITGVSHHLDNPERISLAMKYMRKGLKKEKLLKQYHGSNWQGLEELIP